MVLGEGPEKSFKLAFRPRFTDLHSWGLALLYPNKLIY